MKVYKIAGRTSFTFQIPISDVDLQYFLKNKPTSPKEEYDLRLYDNMGGKCFIVVYNGIPGISQIHSFDSSQIAIKEQDRFKKRGFYKLVLLTLGALGFKTFKVTMQSLDSQKALARMVDTGYISNPRGFTGDSMSMKPTTFDIGKQLPYSYKDKWEEQGYQHWQDYKKEYLQK